MIVNAVLINDSDLVKRKIQLVNKSEGSIRLN